MNELLFRPHLGLGDAVVCNGMLRTIAPNYSEVIWLAKRHNAPSIEFMFRDLPNVRIFPVIDDQDANTCVARAKESGHDVMALGFFGSQPFDRFKWDQEFYRQADVPFDARWEAFSIPRAQEREIPPPSEPYIFVHDDPERMMAIDVQRLPRNFRIVKPDRRTDVIFDWLAVVENAVEIHCIDSSFSNIVDSLTTISARECVLHAYNRETAAQGTFRRPWTILR